VIFIFETAEYNILVANQNVTPFRSGWYNQQFQT